MHTERRNDDGDGVDDEVDDQVDDQIDDGDDGDEDGNVKMKPRRNKGGAIETGARR